MCFKNLSKKHVPNGKNIEYSNYLKDGERPDVARRRALGCHEGRINEARHHEGGKAQQGGPHDRKKIGWIIWWFKMVPIYQSYPNIIADSKGSFLEKYRFDFWMLFFQLGQFSLLYAPKKIVCLLFAAFWS